MRKLQQFYVMKFLSGRLHNNNYDIKRENIGVVREKQEIVSLADSQALRTIREIRYSKQQDLGLTPEYFQQEKLEELIKLKKHLLKIEPNSAKERIANANQIRQIGKNINKMLYIPEYVLVKVEKPSHYRTMIRKGLFITQTDSVTQEVKKFKYVRLLCGAGMARNNTVAFIREDYEKELKQRLQNGMHPVQITPNKYNAYFALSSTATYQLSTPHCCLIDDCEINMTKRVNWVESTQSIDPLANKERILKINKELGFNLFDGGGLIDITRAQQWARELELDYVPSVFIIRNVFVKGCLFTVDFKKFGQTIAKKNTITDLYGHPQKVSECDIILTKSQFKLWNAYDSFEEYQKNCDKFGNRWGVSRVSPKKDDSFFTTNYQFLQVLDLQQKDIEKLCQPTIEWLTGVAGLDRNIALLYLLGNLCNKEGVAPEDIYELASDNLVKALILNPLMIKEQHIRETIIQSINKKIKEAYIGKLVVRGCFNTMIPDPYALLEWAFAEGDVSKVRGLLQEGEHYSRYWNVRGRTNGVGMRSPLTWRSEVNPLKFICNDQTEEWYKYLGSGTIYNVWGCDCMLHADSDFDGDIVANTDNEVFVNCRFKDEDDTLAITYKKNTVPKTPIKESNLYKADIDSFDTTIGQVTNYSTSFYDLLFKFKNQQTPKEKECYQEIIERLKLIRKQQGNSIDAAKGVKVDPFPSIWIRLQPIEEEDTQSIQKQKEFLNEVCADRKPYFFRYRYPACEREYKDFIEAKELWCRSYFHKTLQEILEASDGELTPEELEFKKDYSRYCPLINYHSPMNQICEYLEQRLSIIKQLKKEKTPVEVIELMRTEKVVLNEEVEGVLRGFYRAYMDKKRVLKTRQKAIMKPIMQEQKDNIVTIEQYAKNIRQRAEDYFATINSNRSLNEVIGNYVVEYFYCKYPSKNKSFVWSVFGKYIVENIRINTSAVTQTTTIPYINSQGDINYLGNIYSEYIVPIPNSKEKEGQTHYETIQ